VPFTIPLPVSTSLTGGSLVVEHIAVTTPSAFHEYAYTFPVAIAFP
jgi:hypothetical protein